MLEKPPIPDERIIACLQDEYGVRALRLIFLPLGADRNTAVYRLDAADGRPYFVKLRRGDWNEIVVAVPKYLYDQGIVQIIAPLATKTGQLWASLDAFEVILYPFVEGRNGYEVDLSDRHWAELGTALKSIHTAKVPPPLLERIPRETYSPHWHRVVKTFLERAEDGVFNDPVARNLGTFLKAKRDEILELVDRAERYARALQARPLEFVLCHSDIHAGNVLIDADGALYIVDWDNPILAPKERDLMFPGGSQGFAGHTPQEEEALFYRGYGQTQIDLQARSYYRYERIVEDIAIFCEKIFLTDEGDRDREQSFRYLASNFAPHGTLEVAYESDRAGSE